MPPLLVADRNGIRVIENGAVVTSFLEDVAVQIALPDLGGGVVYQEATTGSWHWAWSEALGRIVMDIADGSGPPAIMALSRPGTIPAVIVARDDSIPTLLQVVRLGGRTAVLYEWTTAEARTGCGLEECVMHELMLQWLDSGERLDLGTLAAFESSVVRFELGDDLIVVITQSYGEQDVCGAVWHRAELFEIGGPGVWIGGGGPFWRRCEFGSPVSPGDSDCEEGCMGWLEAAIAPDGRTIAYVEQPIELAPTASLVVIDAETGVELRRVNLAGVTFQMVSSIDWDGSYAVIRRGSTAGPVVVSPDGEIHELDMTWAALWTKS